MTMSGLIAAHRKISALMSSNTPSPAVNTADTVLYGEDVTRHLAAAVHVDEAFGNEVIQEFVAQPLRAMPPSPGMDTVVVLSEALAGRRQRVIRDSAVLILFLVLITVGWPWSLSWLLLALVGAAGISAVRNNRRRRASGGRAGVAGGWGLFIGAVVMVGAVFSWMASSGWSATVGLDDGSGSDNSVSATFFVLGAMALLGVLAWDKVRLYTLLTNQISREQWHATDNRRAPWPPPEQAWYSRRLRHIADTGDAGNTQVHYGYNAFVGAGTLTQSWTMAIRLEPTDPDTEPVRLAPSDVYQAVREAVLSMKEATGLSPGQRLGTVRTNMVLISSADALLRYRQADSPTDLARSILPNFKQPPRSTIPSEMIDGLVDASPEWVRPYLCTQVSGWHSELVVSTYLHVGCDKNNLYLEWRGYQLNPIKPEYRIEEINLNEFAVMRDMLFDALNVPFSVFARLRTLWRAARDIITSSGLTSTSDPARSYGATRSIREIVADGNANLYFQDADGIRFVKLLQERTLAGVDRVLRKHHLSTTELVGQRNAVVNSTVINGGTFTGVNTIGHGNKTKADVHIGPISISRVSSESSGRGNSS